MEMAPRRIYTVCDKLKECVRKSTEALFELDSGSVTVKVTDPQTRPRAGTQCPGSTWKKYHPHRPNLLHCHDCIRELKHKLMRFKGYLLNIFAAVNTMIQNIS